MEQTMQQLSHEMSMLMGEVEAELGAFLPPPSPLGQHQAHPSHPPPTTASTIASGRAPRQATSLSSTAAPTANPSLPSISLPKQPAPPPLKTRLASLSLLAVPSTTSSTTTSSGTKGAASPAQAGKDRKRVAATWAGATERVGQEETKAGTGAAGAGAGNRAERRRAKWGRTVPAVVEEPIREAKYKAIGKNSLGMLMAKFSKDHILTAEEEKLLAAAGQDLSRIQEMQGLLRGMFKRPPTLGEVAEVMSCEESALRTRIDCGTRARTVLAQKNYRLVVSVAKYVVRLTVGATAAGGLSTAATATDGGAGGNSGGADAAGGALLLADAVTSGMQGLMKAIQKFKPDAGYRFSTYATWWIRQEISRSLRAQALVVSAPPSKREDADRIARLRHKMESELQRQLRPEEVAAAAGVSVERLEELDGMRRALWVSRSLEAPISEGSDRSVGDLVVSQDLDDGPSTEGSGSSLAVDSEAHYALSTELQDIVDSVLEELGPKDAAEVRHMFGLDSIITMSEAGETVEPVRRRRRRMEVEAEAEVLGAGIGDAGGTVPGSMRLELESSSNNYYSANRALRKLQARIAADGRISEWLKAGPGAMPGSYNLPTRTPAYMKKQG